MTNQPQVTMFTQPDYDKLLEPIADITTSIEALLDGAFGSLMGDQREGLKRIYATAWGLHTLLLDIVTNIGIDEMAKRRYLPAKFDDYLTTIITNAQTLLDGIDGPLSDEQIVSVQYIHITGKLLREYIDKLWLYSQLMNGLHTVSPQPTPLTTICDPMNWDVSENDVELELLIPQNAPDIPVHPTLMHTAMTEIIANAVHTTAEGYIRVSFKSEPNAIEISVENTGRAIPAQHCDRIFDPFFQIDPHRPGLGLGLTIVKAIIALHKGSITVVPSTHATRFVVKIPT